MTGKAVQSSKLWWRVEFKDGDERDCKLTEARRMKGEWRYTDRLRPVATAAPPEASLFNVEPRSLEVQIVPGPITNLTCLLLDSLVIGAIDSCVQIEVEPCYTKLSLCHWAHNFDFDRAWIATEICVPLIAVTWSYWAKLNLTGK
jgi:hypothetical protein